MTADAEGAQRPAAPGDLPGAGAAGELPATRSHLLAPTLQALSQRFQGVVVAVLTVDAGTSTMTPVAVFDPDPAGHADLADRVGTAIPLAGTVGALVLDRAVAVPFGDGADPDVGDEMLPEGWLRYAERRGVRSGVILPVVDEDEGEVVALVLAARRLSVPFAPDELASLHESAQRMGVLLPQHPRPDREPGHPRHRRSPRQDRRRRIALDVVVGVVPPAVLAMVLANLTTPNDVRPGAVLVLLSTTVGLVRSRLAAAVCSVAGMAVVWSFNATSAAADDQGGAAAGLVVVALTLVGVQALLERVARSRRRQQRASATVDALVGRLPLGFGLVDRSTRFVQVNDALAALDGVSAPDHVGRRPGDVNPLTGELYEHLLDDVLAGGPAVVDHLVSFEVPETGMVHSWKIDVYPLALDGRVVSAGITVADVTDETVTRRRAQLLLQLARTVAGAATAELVAAAVSGALADGLKVRCVLLLRTEDDLTALSVHGYPDPTATGRWQTFARSRPTSGPAAASFDAGELVTAQVAAAGPADPEEHLHRAVGDVTVVWQPVTRPGEEQVCAAIGVFWPYLRPLTEHSRTLLATAASVTGLALARIDLTERTERDRFRTAMDAMIDQVILAVSVRDPHGEIVDFEIEFANAQALSSTGRTLEDLVGRRVSSLYPRWRTSGMFDRFRAVVETGEPWVVDRLHYHDRSAEGREVRGFWNLQVVKVGDGYIAASRDVTELVANERMAEAAREVAQRERIAVDLLQRAALPVHLPELAGVVLAAHYQPARRQQPVGGDWYDAFSLGDDLLALVIADVAGDGPEAASTMLQVRNILRAVAAEHEDPGRVLARVDEVLHRVSDRDSPFATCCYVTLDARSGCVRWASAGHLPPVLRRAGAAAELLPQEPGPPLASLGGRPFPVASTWLQPGDQFLLYTDGLVERRGEVIDVGLRRLLRQVDAAPAGASADLVRHLADSLDGPSDDTAILCATIEPPDLGDRPGSS